MELSKKMERLVTKEKNKAIKKQKRIERRKYFSKRLRLPLIALVIVFHFISCICIGLVISLYTFPLEKYTEEELNRCSNIAKTIVYSGINKLSYYSIEITASSDGIDIGKIYTSGIDTMDYSKFNINIKLNKFYVSQEGKYIYFTPDDARKDFNYIAVYNISTGAMDFLNSYDEIRYNYILICNSILGVICFAIITLIYSVLGVFKTKQS